MSHRFSGPLRGMLVAGVSCLIFGTAGAADDPATVQLELRKGDSVLFFGDSLTELGGKEEPKQHVTKGYVRIVNETLKEKHPDKGIKVDWVATGGHKVTDLLKRVDRDVIARKPSIVFIQIGVNDANAGVTPGQFVARTVAREQKIPLNDLRRAFVAYWKKHNPDNKPSGFLTYDGNHFNDAGHRFVAIQMLQKFK